MTLSCTIQGNAVSMLAGSFSAGYTLNNRPTGTMSVYYEGAPVGDEGDEVVVTRTSDSVVVFAGRITSVRISVDEAGNKFASYSLSGHEVLADRRIVGEVYINKTTGFIVGDLITKYLAGDGITAGTIDTGLLLPRAVFGYQQLSNVLRALAEANGYIWYIDTAKALHFTERDLLSAPVDIDETVSGERAIRGLRYDRSLTQYRNRQFVQYNELTAERSERFAGDGFNQTFTVEFPIAEKPDVLVNEIPESVGIAGLSENTKWYWSKNSNTISQEVTDPPIGSSSSLTYIGIDTNAQIGISITARGNFAVNLLSSSKELALYQVSNQFGSLLQVFPTGYDAVHGITFIDEEYLALTYTDASVDYIRLIRRVGDSLEFAGVPVYTANPMLLSPECANGEYVATAEEDTIDSLNLYKFDKSAETLTLVETVASSGGIQNPIMVWYGDYIAYASYDDSVKVYKLDRSTDTLTSIYDISEGLGVQVSTAAWVDKYLYTGFSNLTSSPQKTTIIRYSIDIDTDTVTRLGTTTVTGISDSANIVSINTNIFVSGRGGLNPGGNYYEVSIDDGSLRYLGNFSHTNNIATLGLAPIRNIGSSFIIGIASATSPIFIAKPVGGVITVRYKGLFPNVTQVDDFAEQTARIAIEGGTGIYESFQSASDTDTEPAAIDIAQAILERYGKVPRVISFETQVEGFDTGQIVQINWPSLGIIDEEYLIERMAIRDEMATTIYYQLNCISGRDIGNWQEFWRSLRGDAGSFDFGGSDILPKAAAVQDMVTITEEVTAVTLATETNWDEGNWDEMEWQ